MKIKRPVSHVLPCSLVAVLALIKSAGAVGISAGYSQSFDVLAGTGSSSSLPLDWYLAESGANTDGLYSAGFGNSNLGNSYSFGSAGSTDRALGSLRSASLASTFGVLLNNDGTTPVISLDISYSGEQWRLGVTSRLLADRLDFQYSVDATSLTTGTWTDLNDLDFSSPVTSGTAGALNGNLAANRASVSSSISGLSVLAGGTLWLRWVDLDATGADDGLALDDFSVMATFAQPVDPGPQTGVPDAGPSCVLLGISVIGLGLVGRRRS